MNWLMTRTPRERWLVLIMGSMLIIFIGWQFAIKPVLDMRANSRTAQAAAIRDYDIVRIGLPKLRPQSATNKAAFNSGAVNQIARQVGVDVTRMQPGAEGALQVWFEDTSAPKFYGFLSQLTAKYNVTIDRAQITRRDDGLVSSQITLAPL